MRNKIYNIQFRVIGRKFVKLPPSHTHVYYFGLFFFSRYMNRVIFFQCVVSASSAEVYCIAQSVVTDLAITPVHAWDFLSRVSFSIPPVRQLALSFAYTPEGYRRYSFSTFSAVSITINTIGSASHPEKSPSYCRGEIKTPDPHLCNNSLYLLHHQGDWLCAATSNQRQQLEKST